MPWLIRVVSLWSIDRGVGGGGTGGATPDDMGFNEHNRILQLDA